MYFVLYKVRISLRRCAEKSKSCAKNSSIICVFFPATGYLKVHAHFLVPDTNSFILISFLTFFSLPSMYHYQYALYMQHDCILMILYLRPKYTSPFLSRPNTNSCGTWLKLSYWIWIPTYLDLYCLHVLAWLQLWSLGPNKIQGVGTCSDKLYANCFFIKIGRDFRK